MEYKLEKMLNLYFLYYTYQEKQTIGWNFVTNEMNIHFCGKYILKVIKKLRAN